MPRKLQVDNIPNGWQQRVREYIESRPVERCPAELRGPMVEWLNDARVWEAADIVWKASKDHPAVREKFHVLIYSALVGIAIGSIYRPLPNWTKRKYDNIVDSLKDATRHPLFLFSPDTKKEIEAAAILFRALGEHSPTTKAKENGQRMALVQTCRHFHSVFGKHLYDAVGLLMEIGFKGSWNKDRVKARYSAWRDQVSELSTL